MKLVSIIMPVKNAASFLEECLDSILEQTYEQWELIAVNDHSGDHSLDILEKYASHHPRIRVINNSGNGIIPALQKGLQESSGYYVTRMDADDKMPPKRLLLMVDQLTRSPEKTVVTGLVRYFAEGMVSSGYRTYERWLNEVNLSGTQWENIYRECVIASPNWMVGKKELEQIGGFNNLIYPEDYHLVFRWYDHGFEIQALSEVTLLWREHPDRTSRTSEHYQQKAFFWLKINEFVRQDYAAAELVIWGSNRKTRLIKATLQSLEIPWIQMDISNYKNLNTIRNPQVLIGVYPPAKQREKISGYLESIGLEAGKHYWYV